MIHLRPRYSLLSLLVLTALVAGGVKLWRGPHRVVMSDPPTADEQLLLDHLFFGEKLRSGFQPVVYEYEYLNAWTGRQVLFVRGYSTDRRPIPLRNKRSDTPLANLATGHIDPTPAKVFSLVGLRSDEQVVCWMFRTHKHFEALYFLTNQRQLYQFTHYGHLSIEVKRVELRQIDDPEFRASVARAGQDFCP